MLSVEGIDVSHYQGAVDWSAVKASGVGYAWIKCSQAGHADTMAHTNLIGAQSAGLPFGGYDFADPGDVDPAASAAYYLTVARLASPTLPDVLDLETTRVGLVDTTAWAVEWAHTIAAAGRPRPVLYHGAFMQIHGPTGPWVPSSSAVDHAQLAPLFDLWVPKASTVPPSPLIPWKTVDVWQYGQRAVPGIAGAVDADRADPSALARWLGQPTPAPPDPHKEIDPMLDFVSAILRLYEVHLSREPDRPGFSSWCGDFVFKVNAQGATPAAQASVLFEIEEFFAHVSEGGKVSAARVDEINAGAAFAAADHAAASA